MLRIAIDLRNVMSNKDRPLLKDIKLWQFAFAWTKPELGFKISDKYYVLRNVILWSGADKKTAPLYIFKNAVRINL